MTGEKRLNTVFWLAIVTVLMLIGIYIYLTAIALQKSEEHLGNMTMTTSRNIYRWKAGDPAGDLGPAMKRCVAKNPQGCETASVNEVASKCPSGYSVASKYACTKAAVPGAPQPPPPLYHRQHYDWKFGDKPFSTEGAMKRCKQQNPHGCDKLGSKVWAKCKPGYQTTGTMCKKL